MSFDSWSLKTFANYWFDSEFFAVGIFSFAGVAVRVGITNEFAVNHGVSSDYAMTTYGPYLQLFYTQSYLLPNFIGCFVMGICMKEVVFLNNRSKGLCKGLTTGLCGSITTFSSWVNGAIYQTFDSYSWFYIAVMIVLEYWMTYHAFLLGIMVVDLKNEFFLPATKPTNLPATTNENTNTNVQTTLSIPIPEEKEENLHHSSSDLEQNNEGVVVGMEESETTVTEGALEGGATLIATKEMQSNIPNNERLLVEQAAAEIASTTQSSTIIIQSFVTRWQEYAQQNDYWLCYCLIFCLIALPIWIVLIVQSDVAFYTHSLIYRDTFRSIALAPLGAWLRWTLSRIPLLKTILPEYCLYTYSANMIATSLQCALLLWANKQSSWIVAINQGKAQL